MTGNFNLEKGAVSAKTLITLTLIALAGIGITVTGIIFEQQVLRMIPLYVSLVVGALQSRASRYASLIGGVNCLIYTAVYFSFGLYAMAFETLLLSFPLQIATFIRWNRNKYKNSTRFKSLSVRQIIIFGAVAVVAFAVLYALLSVAGSSYRFIDILITLIATAVLLLTLLAYREYTWLMLMSGAANIYLDITMMQDYPEQITYLIFSCYSFICIVMQFFSVRALLKEQEDTSAVRTCKG